MTRTALDAAVVDHLAQTFSGALLRPDDSGYDDARKVFNGGIDRRPALIAQVETVGDKLEERRGEILPALDAVRGRDGHAVVALMVTDIIAKGTELYLSSDDRHRVERAFDHGGTERVIDLPGVMSRKKQVAPRLLAALARG